MQIFTVVKNVFRYIWIHSFWHNKFKCYSCIFGQSPVLSLFIWTALSSGLVFAISWYGKVLKMMGGMILSADSDQSVPMLHDLLL